MSERPPMYGMYPTPPFSHRSAPIPTDTPYNVLVHEDPGPPSAAMATAVFVTKDSGQREQFDTGAKRDTQEGKPRYDLIPPQPLKRLAELYARGAEKYDDHNWTKGMPTSRFLASLERHLQDYKAGKVDEDHLAAVIFNAMGIMYFEGTSHDDKHDWSVPA